MISKFLREQKRYTYQELCEILECTKESAVPIIRKLKEYSILKVVRASEKQKNMSDLFDEDIKIVNVEDDGIEFLYVFTFVGIIALSERILKCYPKYIFEDNKLVEKMATVLKVIERYNSRQQIIRMFYETSESHTFNLLAVILFLLNDYFENGEYDSTKDIVEVNGNGEILWDKTINESFSILSNKRIYYTDIKTKKRVTNDYDYYKRLHQCILSTISKELIAADLNFLFNITEVDISDENLDDFGDKEYILYQIERELNIEFNTRKQLLLKVFYTYIDKGGSLSDMDCFSLIGTNSFNLIWEDVCKEIFCNQLEMSLSSLNLPTLLKPKYEKNNKLIEIIRYPFWSITGFNSKDTLIPDAVTINKVKNDYIFAIIDAKYYSPVLLPLKPPKSHPGIESITKQYLYQLAYQEFIEDHEFNKTINCFIMPTESNYIVDKGYVSMNMFESLGLTNIKVRLLPDYMAYEYYLSGKKMSVTELCF